MRSRERVETLGFQKTREFLQEIMRIQADHKQIPLQCSTSSVGHRPACSLENTSSSAGRHRASKSRFKRDCHCLPRTVKVDLEGASRDQTLRDGAHEQDHSEAPDAVVQRLLQQRGVQSKLAEDLSVIVINQCNRRSSHAANAHSRIRQRS